MRITLGIPLLGSTGAVASSSAGGALSVALAAQTGVKPMLANVAWGVASPAADQSLTVYDGTSSGGVIWRIGIATSGPQVVQFTNPLRGTAGNAMTVILSSGSTGLQTLAVYGLPDTR